MKKNILIYYMAVFTFLFLSLEVSAQNASKARQILDKVASNLQRKGGATANFTITSGNVGTISGSIAMKGNKFYAHTPKATTWFNGKTQWTYIVSSNEVNVSNPSVEQQAQMNPCRYITMYKKGYKLSMVQKGNSFQVHLKSITSGKSIQEMYITINKANYLPTQIKMKQGGKWSTITIKNFKYAQLSDSKFVFKSKDFPKAEVIDLR
ncbi:MAG: outer-membrane lipoprotein carrier protein LolA [Prevotella sp.]|nr:outer-membrane lipoprotein carrier protein LolA [Prevotella sp.]